MVRPAPAGGDFIVFCDADIVAANKPAGMFVHRSDLDARVEDCLLQRVRDALGQRLHAVHRLDRGTSGVVLFARSAEVAAALSAQFASGSVVKRYLAVVRGHPQPAGRIEHPLVPLDPDGRRLRHLPAQAACTDYRRLASVELPFAVDRYPASRYALLELSPHTGRRHQLRRHLKHLAHPIIGDATWGKGRHNRFFAEHFGVARLLLACASMHCVHPRSGETLHVAAPLADDFLRLVDALGWRAALAAPGDAPCSAAADSAIADGTGSPATLHGDGKFC